MIERALYLNKLIRKQWNGKTKIITGIRRSGKSTLLFDIYREYLLNSGTSESDIITIALDDDLYEEFREPSKISDYVRNKCADIFGITNLNFTNYKGKGWLYDCL